VSITLRPEVKKQFIASIRRFFDEKLEQDIGDLKADLVLDYALREIAPTVYNRAIADAQAYFTQRTADLEGSCYEKEFTYWAERPSRDRR
jgi:uncharacterized protein (DUF2164 family)